MLEDLVDTIEPLQNRIKNHRNSIEDYEARTRTTLIDPLLCALGWDVSDPGIVEIEPKVANGWADYALLSTSGKPVMLIEAKKLADKNPPVQQTIGYARQRKHENQQQGSVLCLYQRRYMGGLRSHRSKPGNGD